MTTSQIIMIFQDTDDVKNGVIQLSIGEGNANLTMYFTLAEWQSFKQTVDAFKYNGEPNRFDLKNNPCQGIGQDGYAVKVDFYYGELSAMLYFENPRRLKLNRRWEAFKKQVDGFTPQERSE